MLRVWYSEENFERLRRAAELGQQKGTGPIPIALAYVLNQPFPTVALIGPAERRRTPQLLPRADDRPDDG